MDLVLEAHCLLSLWIIIYNMYVIYHDYRDGVSMNMLQSINFIDT